MYREKEIERGEDIYIYINAYGLLKASDISCIPTLRAGTTSCLKVRQLPCINVRANPCLKVGQRHCIRVGNMTCPNVAQTLCLKVGARACLKFGHIVPERRLKVGSAPGIKVTQFPASKLDNASPKSLKFACLKQHFQGQFILSTR